MLSVLQILLYHHQGADFPPKRGRGGGEGEGGNTEAHFFSEISSLPLFLQYLRCFSQPSQYSVRFPSAQCKEGGETESAFFTGATQNRRRRGVTCGKALHDRRAYCTQEVFITTFMALQSSLTENASMEISSLWSSHHGAVVNESD